MSVYVAFKNVNKNKQPITPVSTILSTMIVGVHEVMANKP